MRMGKARHLTNHKVVKNVITTRGDKADVNRPREKLRCRRKDNSKMDLKELGVYGVAWILLPVDRNQMPDSVRT